MTEFSREFCLKDPVFKQLFDAVKKYHTVADHTEKVLLENRHVKDFCEEARHYAVLPGKNELYIHYDVASWFKEPMGVQVKIESIGVYDDFIEYEAARVRGIHSTSKSAGGNLN